jgi:hypothetical protein
MNQVCPHHDPVSSMFEFAVDLRCRWSLFAINLYLRCIIIAFYVNRLLVALPRAFMQLQP